MSKYKVGDRVKVVSTNGTVAKEGDTGTIVHILESGLSAVRMDRKSNLFHNCDGYTDIDRGQWMSDKNIEKIVEYKKIKYSDRGFKLIITSEGDVTKAKLLHGKGVVRESEVRRYYKDKYSEEDAIKAVIDKLFPPVMQDEQSKKYYTGKVVCIESKYPSRFVLGRVYIIKNGLLFDNEFETLYPIHSLYQLNRTSEPYFKFIELKE